MAVIFGVCCIVWLEFIVVVVMCVCIIYVYRTICCCCKLTACFLAVFLLQLFAQCDGSQYCEHTENKHSQLVAPVIHVLQFKYCLQLYSGAD